jgi:alginate O-acetyltransferase complex protein AlgI
MLFNSLEFIIFFPIVIILYFYIPKKYRWFFLLGSSYYFYMAWDPRFIVLILLSTVVDYFAAIYISKQDDKSKKKRLLWVSLCLNIGMLIGFKYIPFIDENIRAIVELLGFNYPDPPAWIENIILPVGISFYTFQTLSYTIDVYKGVTKPERHFGVFALYVAYWPQLVAGPIERSNQLLPQLRKFHDFDYERIRSGLFRILVGFFKKVVIADRLSAYTNEVYNNYHLAEGVTVYLGAVFFVIQVYCDFSGYSDIAIGSARVMGINLMENFRRPFYAKNLPDFWTRWHISLSTWLTDYVFFYLGAYKATGAKVVFNVIFVLTVCGLWHGPNWPMVLSFTLIGIMMAIRYLWQAYVVRAIRPSNTFKLLNKTPDWLHIFITFNMIVLGFMLFRVDGVVRFYAGNGIDIHWFDVAKAMYTQIWNFSDTSFLIPLMKSNGGLINFALSIALIVFLFTVEGIIKDRPIEEVVLAKSKLFRWVVYVAMVTFMLWFGVFANTEFFYFQF